MTSSQKITRSDIKAKLYDIQDDAMGTVESAKNQLVAAGALVALALILVAFFMGRRGGLRKTTIIEIKRA